VLVTFEPHPLEVVNPQAAPPLLTTGPERREVLAQTPLDFAYFLRFDRHVAGMTPEEFVRGVLLDRCGMRELVIGHDHGFGRGRSGDVDTLRHLGVIHRFDVDVVPPVDFGDQHVSSSRVRRAVGGGDLVSAARMLGRPYTVSGLVGHGEGRGRRIGVPTINLVEVPPQKLLPPDGVYAVRVEWRGGRAEGMMNQGPKPTFADGRRSLEVHLFDFDRDLYGEWVRGLDSHRARIARGRSARRQPGSRWSPQGTTTRQAHAPFGPARRRSRATARTDRTRLTKRPRPA
jgi:riboflavin kinase/FMN adenylyltransferase